MYAGYGDYGANTGPIHIESVPVASPTAAWTDHLTAATEQLGVFRATADGRLFTPHLDPRTPDGGYAERSAAGVWADRIDRIPGAIHVFDIVEFDGALFACGSGRETSGDGDDAIVWRSLDAGATWTVHLRGTAPDPASRFYGMAIVGGDLFTRESAAAETQRLTDAGATWQPALGRNMEPLNPGKPWRVGWVAPRAGSVGGSAAFPLVYFDGAVSVQLAMTARGFDVAANGDLHFVTGDYVRRIPAAGPLSIETVAPIPRKDSEVNCSLALLPGGAQAVVGTSESRLKLVDLT